LTLTSDEASEMKWHEVRDLQAFLARFMKGRCPTSFADLPVECAALFHRRFTEFFREHITCTARETHPDPVTGKSVKRAVPAHPRPASLAQCCIT